jgi:UDP-glucuronate decarboxylase
MPTRIPTTDISELATLLGKASHKLSGKTLLLSGGCGFLGRYFVDLVVHLNERLLEKPCKLVVLDNLITAGGEDVSFPNLPNVTFVEHDIVHPFSCEEPLDYIIQAAGIASPYYYRKYPLETLEVATLGTKNMLQLARDHRVFGFLFLSSSEIYGDPDPKHVPTSESYRGNVSCTGPRACYDESKRLGETLCKIFHEQYGVPTKIVRPFNAYGPAMREKDYRVLPNFASRIVGRRPLQIYGSGKQTRTFCYVTDAINGFLLTLFDGTPGEVYNIGNPQPEISMLDLATAIETVVGRKIDYILVQHPDSYPPDEPMRRCPDITKAVLQLGYRPTVNLHDGLRRFLDWAFKAYAGAR